MARRLSVELYAIGTEVVYGLTLDTNTHELAQEIVRLGGDVRRITQLHDELPTLVEAFRESIQRGAQVVVSTGGLGPTDDDITAAALAELAGVPLEPNEEVACDFAQRLGLNSPAELRWNFARMARLPRGARPLRNTVGWAPGIHLSVEGTDFFALPGPPREMRHVFAEHVAPWMLERGAGKTAHARFLVDIPYESQLVPYLQATADRFPQAYLKPRLADKRREGWLTVDLLVADEDESAARRRLRAVLADLQEQLEAKGHRLELLDQTPS
ncbi:MAG: competence protein ComA [Candidatus Poribacteria bacterium]|nr:MAG: competence protein ComA [Candidatus Poribacteria bacterium]